MILQPISHTHLLLKAEGRFAAVPVATVGFPNIGLQGFAPNPALRDNGEIASLSGAGDDARYFQISVPVQH